MEKLLDLNNITFSPFVFESDLLQGQQDHIVFLKCLSCDHNTYPELSAFKLSDENNILT